MFIRVKIIVGDLTITMRITTITLRITTFTLRITTVTNIWKWIQLLRLYYLHNDIVDNFQSAYKAGHSCETALLRVYNDIVTTIGRGNGAMLVLSAAFDTIDHNNLFYILEKYVGICRNAIKRI